MGPPASRSTHLPFLQRGKGRRCVFCPITSHPCVSRAPQKHNGHILSKWVEVRIRNFQPLFQIKEHSVLSAPFWWKRCFGLTSASPFVAGRCGVTPRQTEMDRSWLVPSLIQWPWKVNFPDTVLWFTAFIPPVLSEHGTTFNFTSVISLPQSAEI